MRILFLILISVNAFSQQGILGFRNPRLSTNPNIAYVIMMNGQSNELGLSPTHDLSVSPLNAITPSLTRQFTKVRTWVKSVGEFQLLEVDVNDGGDKSFGPWTSDTEYSYGFGPDIGLAQVWEQNEDANLYIFKNALGSTSISQWQKSFNTLYPQFASDWQDAKANLEAQGKTVVILSYCWGQGESDMGNGMSQATYYSNLTQLFSDLQADGIIESSTRRVIVELKNPEAPSANPIRDAQQQYVAANPAIARLIDSDFITFIFDNVHFSAWAQLENGVQHYNKTRDKNIDMPGL
jgi:hypothetical protein